MVACVDMALSVILPPPYLFSKPASFLSNSRALGLGPGPGPTSEFQRKRRRIKRHLKLVIGAQLSNSFSFTFGLDSPDLKSFQSHDLSKLSWRGPVPGDIAEVEAYCRIFRNSERLHSALMDALCNPLTGECSVSYEVPSDEKLQLEDKIVSVLGCMVSLVNKGRDEVLTGRSLIMNPFHDVDDSVTEDKLPPLAVFRSEMKRCSESLHVALENYLIPDDDRSLNVWRKLQRLKNVCYDSGFPRREGYPCHTLFSNWTPVYFSTSKDETESEDLETAFWTGGQVTEEGLKWLLDKGFKTIIDIRAETVRDNFYQVAVNDAISLGKIELVKIPVEIMTAPTMEQVVRFASYVSDSSKRPVYLHSKEGVWRSSAMVSRWRQYMTRSSSQNASSPPIIPSKTSESTNSSGKLQDSSVTVARSSIENNITSLQESFDSKSDISISENNYDEKAQGNAALNGISPDNTISEADVNAANKEGSFRSFISKINPLKAQVPPCDIFSKKVMSKFLGSRKISPPDYADYRIKRAKCLPQFKNMAIRRLQRDMIVSNGAIVGSDSINGSAHVDYPSGEPEVGVGGNGKLVNGNTSSSGRTTVNGFSQGELHYTTNANVSGVVNNDTVTTKSQRVEDGTVKAALSLHDEELRTIEGDMCASSTGVVRVQSRKKAEMFLVRTDGFSCTREKVTESSLAFTHPSTQQQMLMWKSTPKNVLLLKKLGDELLEEAKTVVIFFDSKKHNERGSNTLTALVLNPVSMSNLQVATFLHHQEKMNVIVEPDVHDVFARISGFGFVQTFYSHDTSDLHEKVDFVACLGGDGVILHASNLFRDAVPPIVSFNLGSLGFLTSHSVSFSSDNLFYP
ncbi:NAD kinase 2 [Lathyrus oleraceus]|uniref:NAD kinase 2 n=1 Tax=Pisum sativum TaxID=3888 RepID=A0A9D4W1L0_PEA|nr:NAD kinase 2 [Pisum sativum]